MAAPPELEIQPLSPDRWPDLEKLFGPKGAMAGCWCMWWRQTAAEFAEGAGEANRDALRARVTSGPPPGLIAYAAGEPVGWCAIAPRAEFGRLARSPVLKPIDAEPAWAVTCFYMRPRWRGRGVGSALLRAATEFAACRGAFVVEGYPLDGGGRRPANGAAFTGVAAMFLAAGFEEAARRSPGRPIMRWWAPGGQAARGGASSA